LVPQVGEVLDKDHLFNGNQPLMENNEIIRDRADAAKSKMG
jgi:hypothetical protein